MIACKVAVKFRSSMIAQKLKKYLQLYYSFLADSEILKKCQRLNLTQIEFKFL